MAETYLLDLRETRLGPQLAEAAANELTSPVQIAAYFKANGIETDREAGGITLRGDGVVIAALSADPHAIWQNFDNPPSTEEAEREQRKATIKAAAKKLAEGRATAKDRDDILGVLAAEVLRAYGE